MKVYREISLEDFEAWAEAEEVLNVLFENGNCKKVEHHIEECYPNGLSDEDLNDLIRFDEYIGSLAYPESEDE